ncbi:MAG: hypothetical protein U9Q03_00495 [Patescibacteria group bacterium]|nr:hypothetical protein [Patescibacteria group bacterium]
MPEMGTVTTTAQTVTFWAEYAHIIIPLAISLIGGVLTYVVTFTQYKERVSNLKERVDGMEKSLQETRDMAVAAKALVDVKGSLTEAKSPISLSERGSRILTESHAIEFIDDNERFSSLLKRVVSKNSSNAYDVQESSKEVMNELKEEGELDNFKDYLFKQGLLMDDLITVMGIYLRDKILSVKNWNAEDIDRQTPSLD